MLFLVGLNEFDDHDVEVFKRYLTFCGIGIQNAQLFETSVLEYKRNQILLNLARSIFEEQTNLECLVTKIMMEARELLKCERCAVFLMDQECCESVSILSTLNFIKFINSSIFQSHLQRLLHRPANAEKHQILRDDTEDRSFLQKDSSKIQVFFKLKL
jgi:cGMP-specific 3',5'-cyclic phosphodiesterase